MSRYSKIASKYILSKFHQNSTQGTIYERDWTTIGNVHRLEPGKRVYYGNSNFLFTESTIPVYKKKRKNGNWVGNFIYSDVMNAEDVVNLIKINTDSENLSDYAYWGSITELFRGSVEHIIRTFPGRLRSTTNVFRIHHHWNNENNGEEYWTDAPGYILGNPFNLDMHTVDGDIDVDNIIRYIGLSWKDYVIENYDNNGEFPITEYTILNDVYTQYDCEGRYFLLCSIEIFCETYALIVDTYLADGKIVYCYRENEAPATRTYYITYFRESDANKNNENDTETKNTIVPLPENFGICPKKSFIEAYFKKIEGLEWKLLNLRTKPYYQNTFLLPVQLENGNWRLVRRKYTWPSEGIWIDVESTDFNSFVTSMIELCQIYDNLWCDAIWRCMVHESVKNFDWSYRREYDENDEMENIEGGERMKDVMHLYGIIYDKAKRFVDGISKYNNVTYDGYNNCPNAQISDRNTLQGWDIQSTQHMFYWYESYDDFSEIENWVSLPILPVSVGEDSPEYVSVTCEGLPETKYYKKQALPVSDITLDENFYNPENNFLSIVEKQSNPWVENNVYERLYAEVGYASIPVGYDFTQENCTLVDFPYQLFDGVDYPPFVRVVNENGTRYYKLLTNSTEIKANNEQYTNANWFSSVNEYSITPATTDINFNRVLNLSSNRILKTKGTKEAIEMVFSLFGLGCYDEELNPYGDFKIEEQYYRFTAKQLNSVFYFYEIIDVSETEGHVVVSHDSLPENVTQNSDEYIVITTQIESGSSFDTYYHLNGDYTVAEAIKQLYAHRLTERIYDDYYSGVPINEKIKGNKKFVVPFFDSKKQYEGNLYFESKGGWMCTGENSWDNSETIPYLHILQRISDLFTVNTNTNENGDIYFVADVSDYYEYTDDVPYYLSNFFKLKDKFNSSLFTSWVNIPIEGPIQNGGYSGIDGVTVEDYKHAKHLNDIIPLMLYNNPHTGYDRYDMGAEYKSYMNKPYKFSSENYLYDDDFFVNMANQFNFTSEEFEGEKSLITASTISYEENRYSINEGFDADIEPSPIVYEFGNDKYFKITLIENGEPIDSTNPHYRMHLEYMRNVVLKYVAQVIPSTTMVLLSNFDIMEEISNDTVTISSTVIGEGVVYGDGVYLKSSMVSLNAIPSDGYHFVGWQISGQGIYIGEENRINVMACEDTEYVAVFAENCDITYGCITTICSNVQN